MNFLRCERAMTLWPAPPAPLRLPCAPAPVRSPTCWTRYWRSVKRADLLRIPLIAQRAPDEWGTRTFATKEMARILRDAGHSGFQDKCILNTANWQLRTKVAGRRTSDRNGRPDADP